MVEHRIENAGVPGSSPGVAIEVDAPPHRLEAESVDWIVRAKGVGEFIRIDHDEQRRHSEDARGEACAPCEVCRSRGQHKRSVLEPKREDPELPRLTSIHECERRGRDASEVRVERGGESAVLVDPRTFNEQRVYTEHLLAECAEGAIARLLPLEHRIHLACGEKSVSDEQFAQPWRAGIAVSGGWSVGGDHGHTGSSDRLRGDFRRLADFPDFVQLRRRQAGSVAA